MSAEAEVRLRIAEIDPDTRRAIYQLMKPSQLRGRPLAPGFYFFAAREAIGPFDTVEIARERLTAASITEFAGPLVETLMKGYGAPSVVDYAQSEEKIVRVVGIPGVKRSRGPKHKIPPRYNRTETITGHVREFIEAAPFAENTRRVYFTALNAIHEACGSVESDWPKTEAEFAHKLAHYKQSTRNAYWPVIRMVLQCR
jgi:hypothetical protein